MQINVYTDGASAGNPGPGGYGVVIETGGKRKELSGGFRRTTNNRMEIYAAIMGLEALPPGSDVTLYSDSKYLVDAMQQGWPQRWRLNGWKRNAREKALNPDLWERLLKAIAPHKVSFVWVRGHAGHAENERCDRLAVAALRRPNLPADSGYESNGSAEAQPDLFQAVQEAEKPAQPVQSGSGGKITRAGQPCRKCGTAVEKRIPARKHKPGQAYYYAYYFFCPNCKTMYMVDEAKRSVS